MAHAGVSGVQLSAGAEMEAYGVLKRETLSSPTAIVILDFWQRYFSRFDTDHDMRIL